MAKRRAHQSQNILKKLSKTELEILRYIKEGHTSSEIAAIRNCSPRTIEKHRSNSIQKLGIPSSQMALFLWTQNNDIPKNKNSIT